MELLVKLGAIILAPLMAITGFFHSPEEDLGRSVNPVGGKTYTLFGGGIGSTDTSITLTSFAAPVTGAKFSMTDFGDTAQAKGYLTIEPGSATRQEFISFTGLTQNSDGTATLSGVSRGLLPIPPYSASSTYARAHPGGSIVVIADAPQLYEALYSYVDNATSSGAVDASLTVKGISELATGAQAAAGAAIGSGDTTAPLVLYTGIATSTCQSSSGNYVPITNSATGKLLEDCLPNPYTDPVTYTGTTTISGYANVNRLLKTAGYSSFTNSTSSILTYQLPGGTLGTSSVITARIPYFLDSNNGTGARISVGYGGATTTMRVGHTSSNFWEVAATFEVYIFANSSASSQLVTITNSVASSTGVSGIHYGNASSTAGVVSNTINVNSGVVQPITIDIRASDANDTVTVYGALLEHLR